MASIVNRVTEEILKERGVGDGVDADKVLGECRVCKGGIVEKTFIRFDSMTGPPIIGPGSRQQFKKVSDGYYCKKCGIKYEFVPK